MRHFLGGLLVVWVSLGCHTMGVAGETLTLTVPRQILIEAVDAALPITFYPEAEAFEGGVTLASISDLTLGDNLIGGAITLIGQDMFIDTSIGGQSLRLNLGEIQYQSNVHASLSYDGQRRVLVVSPSIPAKTDGMASSNQPVDALLNALLEGRTYELDLNRLEPIITQLGGRQLMTEFAVNDVSVSPETIVISLIPTFTGLP
ncbi:MAG: hypothetical protein N839_0008125 [Desulfofustis sp. PB-SRB1]|jgi:hypothetical protein|nr:hypothetical protein [Desulfofustis sp. PB-SRB1]MBM1002367.1 hypothetical protein [Desulfofustis sp. PB-SRB1]HBH28908.1 hypothetical protein [Desulfofustis sp.]HBH32284.1 hypothetical protein [Desulfofustis sp.]